MKCDEKKPGCERCAKADRECEGYRDLVGITKETSALSTESASISNRPDLSQFSTFLEEEQMTHPYVAFLEQTAPRMAASFISMVESIHEDKLTTLHLADKAQFLWKTLIPDASQNDAATRYAAVALSILHQSLEQAQTVGWQDSGFTRYYNRAIAIVREDKSTDQLHHMLLPCILFAHCELLMGSLNEAMTHIISGSSIITGMQSSGSPLPAIVKNVIAPILNGFIAMSQISNQFDTQFHFPAATHAMLAQFKSIPTAFASFAEAGRSLSELLYRTLLLQELGQPSDRHQATAIRKQANNWSTAFDRLRFTRANTKSRELRKFQLILLAQHRMLQLLLKSMPPEADVHFQHAASDFKIMLAQIRTFVNEVNQGGGIERSMRNVIPVHAGVMMPLFFIAIHCQTTEVRHGALDLLERLSLTEGQWNSCFAHLIAAKLIEVNDSMVQSRGKHGLKLGSSGRLRPVGLEKTCFGHVKLQCLDVSAEGRTEDICEAFIDEGCCLDDLNASWVSPASPYTLLILMMYSHSTPFFDAAASKDPSARTLTNAGTRIHQVCSAYLGILGYRHSRLPRCTKCSRRTRISRILWMRASLIQQLSSITAYTEP